MLDLIIHKFADWGGNEIFIMREDLLPIACGGNKDRIALELVEDAKASGATHIVGYGNSHSNLCRVLAMLCVRDGLGCVMMGLGLRRLMLRLSECEERRSSLACASWANGIESPQWSIAFKPSVRTNKEILLRSFYR